MAEEEGKGELIAVFMNAYRCPQPVTALSIRSATPSSIQIAWETPILPAGTPSIEKYEIEVTNNNTKTVAVVGNITTTSSLVSAYIINL